MSYVEAYDPAFRGRVSLNLQSPSNVQQSSVPADIFLSLLLSKALLSIALHTTKVWLLDTGISCLAITSGFLLVGALGTLCFGGGIYNAATGNAAPAVGAKGKRAKVDWSEVAFYGLGIAFEWTCFWFAVQKLSVLKVVLLSQYNVFWFPSLLTKGHLKLTSSNTLLLTFTAIALTFGSDYYALADTANIAPIARGYAALVLYLFLSARRNMSLQAQPAASASRLHSLGLVVGAAAFLPLGLYGYFTTFPIHSTELASTLLPLLLLSALTILLLDPFVDRTASTSLARLSVVKSGFTMVSICAWFVGLVAFGHRWKWMDLGLVWVTRYCITSIVAEISPVHNTSSTSGSTPQDKLNLLESFELFARRLRAVVKTIMKNDDSRRIYYFLCLNFGYMGIQMAWGIWTNSLGLISDSIHMFFDNAALALGLFASVMSNWPRDSVFTYGYSRVETLSGFANGLFLLLISVFIVFEAIQRLMDPPEMNTNQLLTVSALGLAVNLVGLVATGGHHHHGGGGHSHGHSHGGGADHGDHSSSGHSHNMSGVFLHVMADTLGSVGVIISTLLINRYGWTGFDPLASIFIAVLIFASVVPLVQDSGMLLCLDLGPDREEDVRKALTELSSVEGLSSYAAARFWPKDPDSLVGSIHVQLLPSVSSHDPTRSISESNAHYHNIEKVTKRVDQVLRKAIRGLTELSIQVEPSEGMKTCYCLT